MYVLGSNLMAAAKLRHVPHLALSETVIILYQLDDMHLINCIPSKFLCLGKWMGGGIFL